MVAITFIDHQGGRQQVEIEEGASLMEGALANNVSGILGDCGGCCSCATCHVHVAAEWMAADGEPSEDEAAMLELAIGPDETSRLSCQITVRPALDGLVVTLPPRQI